LNQLSHQALIAALKEAEQSKLDSDFIKLLKKEIKRRGIKSINNQNTKPHND